MTKIKPFKAFIYNQEKISNLCSVVCPPYDVISPTRQEYFHEMSPNNLIHVLLGKDIPGEDKYSRADIIFVDWLKNKILVQDKTPGIYFYSQQYNLEGEKKTRLGFIALLHLGDKDSFVFAHEQTRLEPKEDRLRLLKAVKANLSPIFVLFPDKKRIIQNLWQKEIDNKKPFVDISDDDKVIHKLWRLDSPDIIEGMQLSMSGENIFIADGHHRFEVACAYRDQMKQELKKTTGDEDFNYILAYFTNISPQGLTILPIHRLVKLDTSLDIGNFNNSLQEYFFLDEVKDKTRFSFLMKKAGSSEHVLGMYKNKRYWLLRLKNIKILDKIICDKPREYRLLDVSILNYIVLNKILGFGLADKENISFNPHANELIDTVDKDDAYIAFFLNPVKIEQIMSVALGGNKMPAKSTYFYPKVLSGLVINKHDSIQP